ncbi:hypothetical protein [Magnetospirillum gryphiswaldense]|uniref:Uncharacterized protein n=1 Tax=Magnetospirillum gryphiswaldense TaxID=55518 RepID=A4TW87_9PROT|nr:hypothetical protein [Magnetospirillum gryphiswaldense]AVM75202.1 hypothetical protein MSR1_27320 [Magnetospirillum gryphiswaldense MSR-1]AVM79105.1 hypothetical protein MSR1L_27320 [Magnetospirillum gryphiswaldense]CAM74894.1 conserved hypothetical protein, secreted [Magnetospirillum gryphiswaldense MSR-1]
MRRIFPVLLSGLVLAGCTYSGGDMGDPLTRKFHWFSYVAGDDIRATCQAGTPDHFRLVYNGIYDQQLRLYELDSVRRVLTVKVTAPGNAADLSADDLLGPWRATEGKVQLDEAAYANLVGDFAAAGLFGPPAVGRELPSRGYHWATASCKDGQFRFTGWAYPETDLNTLAFAAPLFAADPTKIAVARPGPIPVDPQYEAKLRNGEVSTFSLKVGAHGMVR